MKAIAVILACFFMSGCYFRQKSDGTYEMYSETVYKIEISGECECVSTGEYEIDAGNGSGYDPQLYSVLDKRKKRVRLPYAATIKVLPRDRVVLGIFSNRSDPKVSIIVKKEGKSFYAKQWDQYLAPIYLNLDG